MEPNVYILDKFIHGDDKDCRKYCNGTGLCQKFCLKKSRCHWDCDFLPCGPNGYCCTLGDTGCPADMASFAPANSYRCMAYKKASTSKGPTSTNSKRLAKTLFLSQFDLALYANALKSEESVSFYHVKQGQFCITI